MSTVEEAAIVPVPRPGKGKYFVWNCEAGAFDEYIVKVGEVQQGNFVDLLIAPPILAAGFLSFNKKVFHLSLHDLLRNHVNVHPSRIKTPNHNLPARTPASGRTNSAVPTNQPGSSFEDGGVPQEHDIRWAEQMQSLLNSDD